MASIEYTPFSKVYNSFLSKITDDMYMELTEQETYNLLYQLLVSAIAKFQFPRHSLIYEQFEIEDQQDPGNDQTTTEFGFVELLSQEEINILATYMIVEWLGQQLASIENVRMKYSGSDFKFTSQANHLQKVLQLKKDYERQGLHLQRLYKRRKKDENGIYHSTMNTIMQNQPRGGSGVWGKWL